VERENVVESWMFCA